MKFPNILIIFIAKALGAAIRIFSLGAGSTWPGHIALKLNQNFVREVLPKRVEVVFIAGTNGKTTTSTLLTYLLEKAGHKVFHNEEGANLLNGVASSIVKSYTFLGKMNFDVAVFEVDENTLPQALDQITPHAVVILNLFRDQLDRYGEVNTISTLWQMALSKLTSDTTVFLNADDPRLKFLGEKLTANVKYFGLSERFLTKKEIPHDVDSIYCPKCEIQLDYSKMSYSHLGDYACPNCGFKRNDRDIFTTELKTSLLGTYNIYNSIAASAVAYFSFNISNSDYKKWLQDFAPAFGRQETVRYRGRDVLILLSKNPTGFNQSIGVVNSIQKEDYTILIALNDRIPDGLDISWIWDVDFEHLAALPKVKKVFVTGDRTYDLSLRLQYAGLASNVTAIDNLQKALEMAVDSTTKGEKLVVLATYSAMLDARQILQGRKLK